MKNTNTAIISTINGFAVNALSNPEPRKVREALQALIADIKGKEGLESLKSADRRFIVMILNRLGQPVLEHIRSSVKAEDLEILEIVTTHRAKAVR